MEGIPDQGEAKMFCGAAWDPGLSSVRGVVFAQIIVAGEGAIKDGARGRQ